MKFIAKLRAMLAVFVALSVTLLFTGCFQMEQVISIKPDGSGTIVMTAVLTKEALKQIEEMSKAGGQGKTPLDEMTDPAKAAEQAKKFGEGVKFVKAEPIKNDVGEGAKLTFSFADVRKIHVDMDLNAGPGGPGGGEKKEKSPVSFGFKKGTLTIKSTHKQPTAAKVEEKENPNEAANLAMMQEMMKGMKLSVFVDIEGTITETDAAHRDGSRITMAVVPFDEVLKDPKKMKAMDKVGSWADALKVLKEIPGVVIEPKETVTVKIK